MATLDPQTLFAAVGSIVMLVAGVEIGLAFLMRAPKEAALE